MSNVNYEQRNWVLLPISAIPPGSVVKKKTGEKLYTVATDIRIFEEDHGNRKSLMRELYNILSPNQSSLFRRVLVPHPTKQPEHTVPLPYCDPFSVNIVNDPDAMFLADLSLNNLIKMATRDE